MPTIVAGHTRHEPTAMNQINQTVTVSDWQPGQGDADTHWSECIRQTDATNVAHLPGWRSAIQNAYGHRPVYLQASDDAGNSGVLPAFLVQHRVFGTVLSSMPFLDAGGPCSSSPALNQGLIEALMQQAEQLGANLVEIRCPQALPVAAPSEGEKVTLVLPLPDSADELWSSLNAKVRNQVRKAERSGLSVEIGQAEQLDAFYEPFIVNMRDLGSPVHGRQFFSAITDAFGDQVWVAVVRKGNTPIGGLIAVACQDSLVVPWASCLREYFSMCPNMLLYWEVIQRACQQGFRRFDFGRSSRDSGTYRFKKQWGPKEEPLFWYTLPVGGQPQQRLSSTDRRGLLLVETWKRLPVGVTRWLGPPIRKYLTQ